MQLKQGYKTTCRHIGFAKFACTQRAQIDQSDQIDQTDQIDWSDWSDQSDTNPGGRFWATS